MTRISKSASYLVKQSEVFDKGFVNLKLRPFLEEIILKGGGQFKSFIPGDSKKMGTVIDFSMVRNPKLIPNSEILCSSFAYIQNIELQRQLVKVGYGKYTIMYTKQAMEIMIDLMSDRLGRNLYVSHVVAKSNRDKESKTYAMPDDYIILTDCCETGMYIVTGTPMEVI